MHDSTQSFIGDVCLCPKPDIGTRIFIWTCVCTLNTILIYDIIFEQQTLFYLHLYCI